MIIVFGGPQAIRQAEVSLRAQLGQSLSNPLATDVLAYTQIRFSVDPNAVTRKQFRFPKSRAKRIRKKWKRNPRNFRYHERPGLQVFEVQDWGRSILSSMPLPPFDWRRL